MGKLVAHGMRQKQKKKQTQKNKQNQELQTNVNMTLNEVWEGTRQSLQAKNAVQTVTKDQQEEWEFIFHGHTRQDAHKRNSRGCLRKPRGASVTSIESDQAEERTSNSSESRVLLTGSKPKLLQRNDLSSASAPSGVAR